MSINHEDYIKKRDKIIRTLAIEVVANHGTSLVGYAERRQLDDRKVEEAAEAIDALVLEVIGEDDVPRNTNEHSRRNFLRYEQRHIVKGDKS